MTNGERAMTVGPKGQVVIPKAIREENGIEPGQKVTVRSTENGKVEIEPRPSRAESLRRLRGMLAGAASTADIEEEHRRELEREEAKFERRAA